MSTIVLNEMVNCSNCEHFELEGIEAVCTHFNEVLDFYVEGCTMCSAYKKRMKIMTIYNGEFVC